MKSILSNILTVFCILSSVQCIAQQFNDVAFPAERDTPDFSIPYYVPPDDIPDYQPSPGNGSSQADAQSIIATDLPDIGVLTTTTNRQSEPCISIDRHNPNYIIVSANTHFSNNGSNDQGYYVSNDGGVTFDPNIGSDSYPFPVGNARGDPFTAIDAESRSFISTMNFSPSRLSVARTDDHENSWAFVTTYIPSGNNVDKPSISVDNLPFSLYKNRVYMTWVDLGTAFSPASVKFTYSTDGGATFHQPSIVLQNNSFFLGPIVKTGPNGEVYVCWNEFTNPPFALTKLAFCKSLDGGIIFSTPQTFNITGVGIGAAPNPMFANTRMIETPSMAVDRSCGLFRGRIYIINPEQDGSTGKCRANLRFSDNNGTTWSGSGFIDIDTEHENFFPAISVDETTGIVCVAYLALEQDVSHCNTWFAYSSNGGVTFTNIKVSYQSHVHKPITSPFIVPGYCGDYIGVDAYGGRAYVAFYDDRITDDFWKVFCSPVTFNAPVTYSSEIDFNINGPVIIDNILASVTYEAINNINATANSSTLQVPSGANCTMRAGNHVKITQGFSALNGSVFHAFIDNVVSCTNPWRIAESGENNLNFNNKNNSKTFSCSAYPNPFLYSFDIKYELNEPSNVNIELWDAMGKRISTLVDNKFYDSGVYKFTVKTNSLSPGIYYYRISTFFQSFTDKLIKLN